MTDVEETAALLVRAHRDLLVPWWSAVMSQRAGLLPAGPGGKQHRIVVPSVVEPDALRVSLILTYDEGAHASGWWRNSDYDRCLHLSMCAVRTDGSGFADLPVLDRRAWPRAAFGPDVTKGWWEPPAGENDPYRYAPTSRYTWHVRLFLDRDTGAVIIPQGEVYTLKPWAAGDSPAKIFRT